jgi:AcrR family transcriptional regulator
VVENRVKAQEARAWATAKSKKRPRLSAVELRERVLSTAVTMLEKSGGLTVSLAHLNMEELIRIADVPRSSVYREWETKEAFYVDLMEQMIAPTEGQGAAWDEETLRIGRAVVKRYADRLETSDGRRDVLREAVRQGVQQNFNAVSRSLSWRTSSALVTTLPALAANDRHRILVALTRAETHFIDRMAAFYEELMPTLGLRLKPPFETKMVAATASSVVEGLIGRSLTNPKIIKTPVMLPGIDGEPVEWHLAAVGFLAILDAMVEPEPNWHQ